MVRDSRTPGTYTVSVFTKAIISENNPCIKHYHIKETNDSPKRYYVAEKYVFDSIPLLIKYHQYNGGGKFLGTKPGRDPHKEEIYRVLIRFFTPHKLATNQSKQTNKNPKTETNKKVPSA